MFVIFRCQVFISCEQHIDLRESRRSSDQKDWDKFKSWLVSHNPFAYEDEHSHALSSGSISITGKDEVNCEQAEELGLVIQSKLDGKKVSELKIKRNDQVKSL